MIVQHLARELAAWTSDIVYCVGVGAGVGVTTGVGVGVGVGVVEGLTVGVGLVEVLGVGEGVAEGVGVGLVFSVISGVLVLLIWLASQPAAKRLMAKKPARYTFFIFLF